MTTISRILLPAALVLALTAELAVAQETNPPTPDTKMGAQMADQGPDHDHGKHHGKRKGHGMRGIMLLDINNDGFINPDEAAGFAEAAFMHLDRNHDGVIDETEASTPPGRGLRQWMNGGPPQEMVDKMKAAFTERDTDKDGKVTKIEFMNFAQAKYASLDAAKDGKVSPWEFRKLPRL